MASTLDELKAVNPKFTDAKSAVVRPDIVLRDLIHIFHPELVSDSLYYYRHLE